MWGKTKMVIWLSAARNDVADLTRFLAQSESSGADAHSPVAAIECMLAIEC
jgi:hypothetical protein